MPKELIETKSAETFVFGFKPYDDLNRIAIISERRWEEAMAKLGKYFTSAEIKYFPVGDQHHAIDWFRVGGTPAASQRFWKSSTVTTPD